MCEGSISMVLYSGKTNAKVRTLLIDISVLTSGTLKFLQVFRFPF